MFAEVTGNGFAELDRLVGELSRTTGGQLARTVAGAGAEAISGLQTEQFAMGVSPRGIAHAPLSPLSRQGTPLHDSGALLESARVMHFGLELRISSELVQTNVQMYGATIYPVQARALSWVANGTRYFAGKVTIPARPFVPTPGTLPEPWAAVLQDAEQKTVPPFLPSSP